MMSPRKDYNWMAGMLERGRLRLYRLKPKTAYETVRRRVAFPFLAPADLMRFVERRAEIGENAVVREFVDWAQKARSAAR